MKYAVLFTGVAGDTERITVTNDSQYLVALLTIDATKVLIGVLITCEDYPIRFAMKDAVPTNVANPVGHILYAGQSLKLINSQQVGTFKIINLTIGEDAFLQVTPEYEI